MKIVGMPYALLSAGIIAITNVIPFFGPFIGGIPTVFIILLTDVRDGIIYGIFLVVLQQIEGNLIYPKVVGSSTGLHPLAVLLSVSVFGYFGGILGMLLAVPTAGVLAIFIRKWAARREAKILARANAHEPDKTE
jgi:predicted PurR-regulated permease PerM